MLTSCSALPAHAADALQMTDFYILHLYIYGVHEKKDWLIHWSQTLDFGLFVLKPSRLGCWGWNRQQKKPAQSKDNSKVTLGCQVLLPQTCTKDLPSIFLLHLSAFAIYETITFYKCLSYSLLFYCTRLLSISVCWPQSPSFNLLSLPALYFSNECCFHAVYDQFSWGKVPLLLLPTVWGYI